MPQKEKSDKPKKQPTDRKPAPRPSPKDVRDGEKRTGTDWGGPMKKQDD